MMTTSSSSCIIKPGTGIEIVQFVPPAQSDIAPPMQKSGDKEEHAHTGKNSPAPAKRTAEPGAADVVEDRQGAGPADSVKGQPDGRGYSQGSRETGGAA